REVCRHWACDRQSDFNTLLNAVLMGLRGVLDVESVGYYRNIADDRREFQRKVRTVVRGMAVLHRNVRMLNPFQHGMFAWQFAFYAAAIGGAWTGAPALKIPMFFLLANLGVLTACLRYARGERLST